MTLPRLPPFIFLMSDHTTHALACAVADELAKRHSTVFIDDFLAPIHEGFSAMFEMDWKRDIGHANSSNRIFLPAGEQTERDIIVSLEKWFNETFGEHLLGKLARKRCDERNALADYITVFRDATQMHLSSFIPSPPYLSPYDHIAVQLVTESTVDSVIKALEA